MAKVTPAANKEAMLESREAKKLLYHAQELSAILNEQELTGQALGEVLEQQVLEHVDALHDVLRQTKIGFALPRWYDRRAAQRAAVEAARAAQQEEQEEGEVANA